MWTQSHKLEPLRDTFHDKYVYKNSTFTQITGPFRPLNMSNPFNFKKQIWPPLLFQPTFMEGWDFVLGILFFSFSVFVDFLNCVFWHLWYIIRKLLKSSFICTEASFSGLFVWKLRGFKVFQNLPIIVGTCSTSSCKFRLIQEYLEEHLNKSL